MAYTYSLISSYTVGSSGVSTIDFLNIPQTYTDLFIKVSARSTGTGGSGFDDYLNIRFNGDTGNNYGDKWIQSYAATPASGGNSSRNKVLAGLGNGSSSTSSTFASNDIYIPNYSSGFSYKSISIDGALENNNTSDYVIRSIASIWNNTSPITSVKLFLDGNTFAQYSSAQLYGIKAEV